MQKQRDYFICYDSLGREIQYGRWGESHCQGYSNGNDSGWIVLNIGCSFDYTKIKWVDFYFYDAAGRKTKEESWGYKNDVKTSLWSYTHYLYNEDGSIHREMRYNNKDSVEKTTTYEYNKKGKVTNVVDSSDLLWLNHKLTPSISITQNEYDTAGRIKLSMHYFNGSLSYKEQFLYEYKDRETELKYYNEKDGLNLFKISETNYSYLGNGHYQAENVFEKIVNGRETHEIYKYNKYGLKTRVDHYEGLERTGYTKFEYDFY